MDILPKQIQKYLNKQSLSKWDIETNNKALYSNIIIIPALSEYENIEKLITSLELNSKIFLDDTLIIFIANNLYSHSDKIRNDNIKLIAYLRSYINKKKPLLNIGIVDASTKNKVLPKKDGGVGFARKIGMDLALSYFNYNNKSKNLLISLDADCTVSNNYLEMISTKFNQNNYFAGYVNFQHTLPQEVEKQKAIINYEIFLRYYVLGLQYAKSHFAFPSVGSTMICEVNSYIKVGGMNKRKAGEDFYFMEKLAKITNINKINGATVFLSARTSWRVPFGTGQRVSRYLLNEQNEYLLYSLKSFQVLKKWLGIFHSKDNFSSKYYLGKAKKINLNLFNFLVKQGFEKNWNKILENSKTKEQIKKQKIFWMDGFKTLKLIHYLRDNEFPQENMFETLDKLFMKLGRTKIIQQDKEIPSIEIQLQYLETLR